MRIYFIGFGLFSSPVGVFSGKTQRAPEIVALGELGLVVRGSEEDTVSSLSGAERLLALVADPTPHSLPGKISF